MSILVDSTNLNKKEEVEKMLGGKLYSYSDYQKTNLETGIFVIDTDELTELTYRSVQINHECIFIMKELSEKDFESKQLLNDISSLSKSMLKVFNTRFDTEDVSYAMFIETDFDLVFLTYQEKVKKLNNSETNKLLSDMEQEIMKLKNNSVVILKG